MAGRIMIIPEVIWFSYTHHCQAVLWYEVDGGLFRSLLFMWLLLLLLFLIGSEVHGCNPIRSCNHTPAVEPFLQWELTRMELVRHSALSCVRLYFTIEHIVLLIHYCHIHHHFVLAIASLFAFFLVVPAILLLLVFHFLGGSSLVRLSLVWTEIHFRLWYCLLILSLIPRSNRCCLLVFWWRRLGRLRFLLGGWRRLFNFLFNHHHWFGFRFRFQKSLLSHIIIPRKGLVLDRFFGLGINDHFEEWELVKVTVPNPK